MATSTFGTVSTRSASASSTDTTQQYHPLASHTMAQPWPLLARSWMRHRSRIPSLRIRFTLDMLLTKRRSQNKEITGPISMKKLWCQTVFSGHNSLTLVGKLWKSNLHRQWPDWIEISCAMQVAYQQWYSQLEYQRKACFMGMKFSSKTHFSMKL